MGIYLLMIAGAMLLIMSFEDLIGHYPDFPERLAGPGNQGNSLITDGVAISNRLLRCKARFCLSEFG